MVTKDLTFLLRLLQTSKQSGLLLVEAGGQDNTNDTSWQGQFQLENGLVKSCLVLNSATGRVLFTNEDAINWLMKQGKLEWRIVENMQLSILSPTQPAERNIDTSQSDTERQLAQLWEKRRKIVFQRTVRGSAAPAQAFPTREHRQIFALIDGYRTTEEIVRLLHKPPGNVLRLLQELLNAGFVA